MTTFLMIKCNVNQSHMTKMCFHANLVLHNNGYRTIKNSLHSRSSP